MRFPIAVREFGNPEAALNVTSVGHICDYERDNKCNKHSRD